MPKRSSTEHGFFVSRVARSTGDIDIREKNPAAVALGRLGGLRGGPARAEKLSAEKRREIAHNAALQRWNKR